MTTTTDTPARELRVFEYNVTELIMRFAERIALGMPLEQMRLPLFDNKHMLIDKISLSQDGTAELTGQLCLAEESIQGVLTVHLDGGELKLGLFVEQS